MVRCYLQFTELAVNRTRQGKAYNVIDLIFKVRVGAKCHYMTI